MPRSPATIASLARTVADRVPAVRAIGGTRTIEQSARTAQQASSELGGPLELGRELLRDIPALARLLYRLARDPRVSWRHRAALAGVALYVVSPIDPIPDWLPVVGAADDVVVVLGTLRWVLASVDPDVLAEHWDGERIVLELLTGRERTARP